MTALTTNPPLALPRLNDLTRDAPAMTMGAIVLMLFALPVLGAMALDTREIAGINPWIKPLKFILSLVLYMLTLAWAARLLPEAMRAKRSFRIYVGIVMLCIALEMIWIAGASFAGTTSHFNESSVFMALTYAAMGLAAVTLTSASFVWGLAIWRNQDGAFARAVAVSLMLTFLLTVPTAGYLSGAGSHFVGDATSDAGGLFLMGWSREVGDLRVAHFFATHAMQIIPAAFAVLLWIAGARLPKGTSAVLAVGYVLLTGGTFIQALQGKPFLG